MTTFNQAAAIILSKSHHISTIITKWMSKMIMKRFKSSQKINSLMMMMKLITSRLVILSEVLLLMMLLIKKRMLRSIFRLIFDCDDRVSEIERYKKKK